MQKLLRSVLVLAFSVVVMSCGGPFSRYIRTMNPMPPGGVFTGHFYCASVWRQRWDYGLMVDMVQTGDHVIGEFGGTDASGTFEGTVRGDLLEFQWTDTMNNHGSGFFQLDAQDGITVSGEWAAAGAWVADNDRQSEIHVWTEIFWLSRSFLHDDPGSLGDMLSRLQSATEYPWPDSVMSIRFADERLVQIESRTAAAQAADAEALAAMTPEERQQRDGLEQQRAEQGRSRRPEARETARGERPRVTEPSTPSAAESVLSALSGALQESGAQHEQAIQGQPAALQQMIDRARGVDEQRACIDEQQRLQREAVTRAERERVDRERADRELARVQEAQQAAERWRVEQERTATLQRRASRVSRIIRAPLQLGNGLQMNAQRIRAQLTCHRASNGERGDMIAVRFDNQTDWLADIRVMAVDPDFGGGQSFWRGWYRIEPRSTLGDLSETGLFPVCAARGSDPAAAIRVEVRPVPCPLRSPRFPWNGCECRDHVGGPSPGVLFEESGTQYAGCCDRLDFDLDSMMCRWDR